MEPATTGPQHHDPEMLWDDRASLCGMHLHYCPSVNQNYWEAVGPAAEAWSALSPQIRTVADDLAPTDSTFSIHVVMIGESKCMARPCILFCTTDLRLRDAVHDCQFLRDIMTEYPALAIEFSDNPPELLAGGSAGPPESTTLAPGQQTDPAVGAADVWAADVPQMMGRRLYICDPAGGPPRIATGGPVFFFGSKAYQTTVRHAFSRLETPPPFDSQPCFQTDLRWETSEGSDDDYDDDDSDDDHDDHEDEDEDEDEDEEDEEDEDEDEEDEEDEDEEDEDEEGEDEDEDDDDDDNDDYEVSAKPAGLHHITYGDASLGCMPGLGISPSSAPTLQSPPPVPTPSQSGLPSDSESPNDSDLAGPKMPTGSIRIGSAMQETIRDARRALDYVLVEVQIGDNEDANWVSFDRFNETRKIRVKKPGHANEIKPDANLNPSVVVITSSGPSNGRLSATKALIKPIGWTKAQDVYPIKMDENQGLQPGDCGSAVIDMLEGWVFGHIVFGHPGTNVAYMLPMDDIIEDMAKVLGPDPRQPLSLRRMGDPVRRGNSSIENRKFIEFASPRYYEGVNHRTMPEKHIIRSLVGTIEDKVGGSIRALASRCKTRLRRDVTFEALFFSLPPELRDNVIQFLDLRSAMNLRAVSQRWWDQVSVNCLAILEHFLVNHPFPLLANQLYRHNLGSPDILLIQRVGRSHATASRLTDYISKWLAKDIYLHRTRVQLVDFQKTKLQIKRRLLPPLFVLVHFFQAYRQCLARLPRHCDCGEMPNPCDIQSNLRELERSIMQGYDPSHILSTQDAALILIEYLRRITRPPSKYGHVERAVRHYLKDPPSDQEVAGVLCLGGLDVVVNILDAGGYDKRVAAVHSFLRSSGPHRLGPRPNAGERSGRTAGPPELDDMRALLPHVPKLDGIWRRTGVELLMEKGAIRTPTDLNNFQQALNELIRRDETPVDQLYKEGHAPWHALCDREIRLEDHHPSES